MVNKLYYQVYDGGIGLCNAFACCVWIYVLHNYVSILQTRNIRHLDFGLDNLDVDQNSLLCCGVLRIDDSCECIF